MVGCRLLAIKIYNGLVDYSELFFMRYLIIVFTLLGLSCLVSASPQLNIEKKSKGISFYVLRVIYPESENKGVSLKADNKTEAPYLMQSYIRPVDLSTGDVDLNYNANAIMPFIVTPPLARLEPNQSLDLRIRRNGQQLPTDRESVYFISMKALPAQDNQRKDSNMVVTVVTNIKVFFRPEGLAKRAVADMANKLEFEQQGKTLIAKNPTPYWLTFSMLKVGNNAIDKSKLRMMVPPFGQQQYVLPNNSKGEVSWQLIDEDGWNTTVETRHAVEIN